MSRNSRIPQWALHGYGSSPARPTTAPQGYVPYKSARAERNSPKQFRPTGTFNSLEKKGELAITGKSFGIKKKKKIPPLKGKMPGYTGYIRGKNLIFGRTYGQTSRLSMEIDYRKHVADPPVPSGPQHEVPVLDMTRATSMAAAQDQAYYVPGFSSARRADKSKLDRVRGIKFGAIKRDRYMCSVGSNPMPGQTKYATPRKVVPEALRGLRYTA